MASNMKAFLKGSRAIHTVGTVTSFRQPQTLTDGAAVKEVGGVDVFRLVEIAYVDGKATCKYATASAKEGNIFLVVNPQDVLESMGEQRSDFFVAEGEMANCAYLEKGMTFQTSAIEGATVGAVVVWDAAKKLFVAKAPADTDVHVFQVQDIETEESYTIDGQKLVELRVVK